MRICLPKLEIGVARASARQYGRTPNDDEQQLLSQLQRVTRPKLGVRDGRSVL